VYLYGCVFALLARRWGVLFGGGNPGASGKDTCPVREREVVEAGRGHFHFPFRLLSRHMEDLTATGAQAHLSWKGGGL